MSMRQNGSTRYQDVDLVTMSIKLKHLVLAKRLLELCPVDCLAQTDNNGDTPLHCAAKSGHDGLIKAVLNRVGSQTITTPDHKKRTALDIAIKCGNTAGVRLIIDEMNFDQVRDVCANRQTGRTLLYHAAEAGHRSTIDMIFNKIEQAANADSVFGKEWKRRAIEEARTRLFAADEVGQTPLHRAAAFGYLDIINLFLTKMALNLIDQQDYNGDDAIGLARTFGYVKVAAVIQSHCRPLREAAMHASGHSSGSESHKSDRYKAVDPLEAAVSTFHFADEERTFKFIDSTNLVRCCKDRATQMKTRGDSRHEGQTGGPPARSYGAIVDHRSLGGGGHKSPVWTFCAVVPGNAITRTSDA